MQFARTTGPFLEHELVDQVDAAGRRLLEHAVLDDVEPAATGDRTTEDAPVRRGRER